VRRNKTVSEARTKVKEERLLHFSSLVSRPSPKLRATLVELPPESGYLPSAFPGQEE
jgi:hypothetical protein